MTSLSLGEPLRSSKAVAETSMPVVHIPHWAAARRREDPCRRPNKGGGRESPSTVVTSCPSTCAIATRQAQTGSPSTKTVQAPQSPASQPTLVPVSPRLLRSPLDSRSTGGTETVTPHPFTEKVTDV